MAERDIRSEMINQLLTTPHRNLARIYPLHQEMIRLDPVFYVHLAAWYASCGEVRDHKEMFVISLCLSSFEGHRETGLALLRELPPYELARVVDFIKGREVKQIMNKPAPSGQKVKTVTVQTQEGCFQNVPRSMRTEIQRYLREREQSDEWFDRTVLNARKPLKRLYAGLHIQPSERAQAILFADNPPEGSLPFIVKKINQAQTPAEQARAIVEYRIPYRVASTVIQQMSPTVVAALVEIMTPQELINNISSLQKRGALDNPEIKEMVEAKVKTAKSDKRVSAFKAKVATVASGVTGALAAALEDVTEAKVQAKGQITRSTALLIDKSGSMNMAIAVGLQLGAMISAISAAELYAYAFDSVSYPVESRGKTLKDWEKALAGINAVGNTSCGISLDWMRKKGQRVEQIVMVTDEGENTAPLFKDAYKAYCEELAVKPAVIFVKIGNAACILENACAELGVAPQVFEFKGDYYSLPNVIPLLTYPSLAEMVMEILAYPLPERKAQ